MPGGRGTHPEQHGSRISGLDGIVEQHALSDDKSVHSYQIAGVIEQNAASVKAQMQTGHCPRALRDSAMASGVQVTRLQDRVGHLEGESRRHEEELGEPRHGRIMLS